MTERCNKGHHVEVQLIGGPLNGQSIFISPAELAKELRYSWTEDGEVCTIIKEAFYHVTGAVTYKDDLSSSAPRKLVADYVTTLHYPVGLVSDPKAAR